MATEERSPPSSEQSQDDAEDAAVDAIKDTKMEESDEGDSSSSGSDGEEEEESETEVSSEDGSEETQGSTDGPRTRSKRKHPQEPQDPVKVRKISQQTEKGLFGQRVYVHKFFKERQYNVAPFKERSSYLDKSLQRDKLMKAGKDWAKDNISPTLIPFFGDLEKSAFEKNHGELMNAYKELNQQRVDAGEPGYSSKKAKTIFVPESYLLELLSKPELMKETTHILTAWYENDVPIDEDLYEAIAPIAKERKVQPKVASEPTEAEKSEALKKECTEALMKVEFKELPSLVSSEDPRYRLALDQIMKATWQQLLQWLTEQDGLLAVLLAHTLYRDLTLGRIFNALKQKKAHQKAMPKKLWKEWIESVANMSYKSANNRMNYATFVEEHPGAELISKHFSLDKFLEYGPDLMKRAIEDSETLTKKWVHKDFE